MGYKNSSLLCLTLFLAVSSSIHAFDITKLLGQNPEFATFNKYLTETKLADQINSRNTITVLVVNDGALSSLSGKSQEFIKATLSTHVILDFFDQKKLMEAMGSGQQLTTLYQASGVAANQQGFIKVALVGEGGIAFGSAVSGAPLDAELMKTVVSEPTNIAIFQITKLIVVPGLADGQTPSTPSSNAQSPPVADKAPTTTQSPPVADKAPAATQSPPVADKAPAATQSPPVATKAPVETTKAPVAPATETAKAPVATETAKAPAAPATQTAKTPVATETAKAPAAPATQTAKAPVATETAKAPVATETAKAPAAQSTAKAPVQSATAPAPAKVAQTPKEVATPTEAPTTTAAAPKTTAEAPTTTAEAPTTTAEAPSTTAAAPTTTAEAPAAVTEAPTEAVTPAGSTVADQAADASTPPSSSSRTQIGFVGAVVAFASLLVAM